MPARLRPDASPGLLRRRYSVPETVMRRYRVARQRAVDCCDESGPDSPFSAPARVSPHSRDDVRRAALLRRMWGRTPLCVCRQARSLDGSHADLCRPTYVLSPSVDPPSTSCSTPAMGASSATSRAALSSCEVLEIVVTGSSRARAQSLRMPTATGISIDDYVSSVLIDSLNSLSDRLDYVTSRVQGDGKISVVEKEIKVKLQSTGVNTVVHLSPTSNNQIIFGNEEICDGGPRGETPGVEPCDRVDSAFLQQIQKLFRKDDPNLITDAAKEPPTVPHIEMSNVSNVDVFLDDCAEAYRPRDTAMATHADLQALSAIGTGNYFEASEESALVPRFPALPHTASMEVNTSSEDDTEFPGSECISLVDSLDDRNSPHSVTISRAIAGYQPERVHSAFDAPQITPEVVRDEGRADPKEKSKYFFVGIEDGNCDREKTNINVADRLPKQIKQRLLCRHRQRQQRMESARRSRAQWLRHGNTNCKKKVAKEKCASIIKDLIDDVILKIVRDEYECARMEHEPHRNTTTESHEKPFKKSREKQSQPGGVTSSTSTAMCTSGESSATRTLNKSTARDRTSGGGHSDRPHRACRKLSLMSQPALPANGGRPQRLYQKSEIRQGKNCVEILEILEYADDARRADVPVNNESKRGGKKSRIPVPVYEKTNRLLNSFNRSSLAEESSPPSLTSGPHAERANLRRGSVGDVRDVPASPPTRRASLPQDRILRSRSGAVRFRRVFDVIPEECSISVESSIEDATIDHVPNTKSVATSPLARPPSAPPREKDLGRRPPALHREEGLRGRSDGHGVPSSPPSDQKSNHFESHGKIHTKTIKTDFTSHRPKRIEPVASSQSLHTDEAKWYRKVNQNASVGQSDGDPSGDGNDFDTQECSSSGESTPCLLAPRWVTTRRHRHQTASLHVPPPRALSKPRSSYGVDPGDWSVTVAGSCRAVLPADVEMRLRFPRCERRRATRRETRHNVAAGPQDAECACCCKPVSLPAERLPPALTVTVQKEARDSSFRATKSMMKSTEQLPEVETYRASRSRTKSSVKAVVSDAARVLPGVLAARSGSGVPRRQRR